MWSQTIYHSLITKADDFMAMSLQAALNRQNGSLAYYTAKPGHDGNAQLLPTLGPLDAHPCRLPSS